VTKMPNSRKKASTYPPVFILFSFILASKPPCADV
jgi:hypothetical protein